MTYSEDDYNNSSSRDNYHGDDARHATYDVVRSDTHDIRDDDSCDRLHRQHQWSGDKVPALKKWQDYDDLSDDVFLKEDENHHQQQPTNSPPASTSLLRPPGEEKSGQNATYTLGNEDDQSERKTEKPEGLWCWVVLAASFIILMLLDGVNYSFGVMMEPLHIEMGGGDKEISVAGSLQVTVYCFAGLLAAKLTSRHGARLVCGLGNLVAALGLLLASFAWNLPTLLATYSIITGIGFGMMYIPAIVAVAQHFTDGRRSLALGICVCGTGVGTFVFAPLETTIIHHLGWRWTMVVLSVLCLLCLLLSATMKPVSQEQVTTDNQPVNQVDARPRQRNQIRKNYLQKLGCWILSEELYFHPNVVTFGLVALADAVGTLGLFIPFTYLPELAAVSGIHHEQAAWLVSGIGISSSVGRIASGWVDDQPWSNPVLLTAVVLTLASLQPFLLAWSTSYVVLMVVCCSYGLLTGVWIAAASPMLLSVLGLDLLTPAFGFITAFQGLAALVGPPMAGLLVDTLDSVQAAMMFSGGVLFLGAALFFVSYWHEKMMKRRSGYQQI